MNAVVKKVRDYFTEKSNLLMIDSEQLERAVDSLKPEEYAILQSNDDPDYGPYDFVLHKVFYRHNDFVAGVSDLDEDGNIMCSALSAITELDISYDTYQACYDEGYIHIEDIDKDDFPSFSFEVIADLTSAIIEFSATQQVMLEV